MRKFFPVCLILVCAALAPVFSQDQGAGNQDSGGALDFDQVRADEEFRSGVRAFHNAFYNEAILSFQRSLSFKPAAAATRSWLGRAYYLAGFTDAALAEWKTAAASTGGSALLESFIEILETRQGIVRELQGGEKWVLAGDIQGTAGEQTIFRRPVTVHARGDGSVFVVSYLTNEIVRIDLNGIVRQRLRGGLAGFDHPFDLVEADDGTLYVSEFRGDRVTKCSASGSVISVLGGKGRGEGQLLGPQYLALDPEGSLYVSDWGNRRVVKFNRDGEFVTSFGQKNDFYPGFLAPTGIAFHNEYVYVADSLRKHIAVFDPSGNYIRTLLAGRLSSPEGIRVLENGNFLISDTQRLFSYNAESGELALLSDFGGQAKRVLAADEDANGNIVAADFDTGTIHVLSELTGISSGLTAMIKRITAAEHPDVLVDVHVSNRMGEPVVGLSAQNFIVTERRLAVGAAEMPFASYRSETLDLALIVGRSAGMADAQALTERIVRDVAEKLSDFAAFRVVSPGPTPAIVSRPGDSREFMVNAAVDKKENYEPAWAFDLGVRLGVTELLSSRNRKAVIFITDGNLGPGAFKSYGLQETLDYMRNNSIVFYPVYIQPPSSGEELDFLAKETGGRVYGYYNAGALGNLARDLAKQKDGSYLLSYRSSQPTDFGRAYIPVEVEVNLVRRSGRDEAGYFAPLEF
ncbi:MAG: 6-bladed beta-propeller [Spirochaetales bacterium]|jgi:DNA-binding beta-propeller fold protein YncE|nr:6-bladed beta-propeller [Spirochaetales bacterium]